MAYFDRLNQGSYESPSGSSFSFSYQAVTREIVHRIGAFEFAGVNGTFHQDKGISGEIYPLTIFIHGQDYDVAADAFLAATKETGAGFLIHPRWGRKRVQVIKCTQREDLTREAAQAVFTVEFQESLETEFPVIGDYLNFEVLSLADKFQDSAIVNFLDQVLTTSAAIRLAFKQNMLAAAAIVNTLLQPVTSGSEQIAAEFRAHIANIEDNVDVFTVAPEGFADSIVSAIRLVASVPGKVDLKLQSYGVLLDTLSVPAFEDKNSVLVNEILTTSIVVGISESVNTAFFNTSRIKRDPEGRAVTFIPSPGVGFQTRGEVLDAVVFVRDSFANTVFLLDESQTLSKELTLSDAYIQAVESYGPTASVVTKTILAGLNLSFSLPAQRTLVLETDDTIVNQCFALYGNIDDTTLDFFIFTNLLRGEEILTLPRGKEIVYYA